MQGTVGDDHQAADTSVEPSYGRTEQRLPQARRQDIRSLAALDQGLEPGDSRLQ